MTTKQAAVKKYIVKLSDAERERLNTLIQKGKSPVRQVLKARILLKADASERGEAWSDGQIAEALDTSIDTVARTRQHLVEEGLDAALTRKHSPNSARKRIFDGAAEAKLIARLLATAQRTQAVDCQCRLKSSQKWRSKIPSSLRRSSERD